MPQAGFFVLIGNERLEQIKRNADDLLTAGMILGHKVDIIQQRNRHPAHGTAPELGRTAGFFVRPVNLTLVVVSVIHQAGLFITGLGFHQRRLLCDLIKKERLVEGLAVLGAEGAGHVQPVQPHLVAVPGLVPEAAFGRGGEMLHEVGNSIQRRLVAGIAGAFVQREQVDGRLQVVQLAGVEVLDVAHFIQIAVHPRFDEIEILFIPGQQIGAVHAGEEHTLMIVEMPHRRQLFGLKFAHHGIAGKRGKAQRAGRFLVHGNGLLLVDEQREKICCHYSAKGGR